MSTYLAEIDQIVPLYHPRKEEWSDHFRIEGGAILGLTVMGKATVQLLQMNLPERIMVRQLLIQVDEFPAIE